MSSVIDSERLADELLLIIRRRTGEPVPLSGIRRKLGVDRSAIIEAVDCLKEWGYRVECNSSQVLFIGAPDVLSATEIEYGLKTKVIGRKVLAYRKVKSTNDIACSLAASGADEGVIVVAEEQTAGRGRLGRKWYSPVGTGIYLSIVLRPSFSPEHAPGVSVMTGLALAETLNRYCPGRVRLKWPNDLLISGRKVSGILTELTAEKDRISYLIVGVGINVNQAREQFDPEIRHLATSMRRACRHKVSRVELLQKFLKQFEKEYALYRKRMLQPSRKRLRAFSSLHGRTIELVSGRKRIDGVAGDILGDGSLQLMVAGEEVSVASGEVTVAKR